MTFFFNGGREAAFDLEDRQLVSSPKVATYNLQPEMSVGGVAEAVSETSPNQHRQTCWGWGLGGGMAAVSHPLNGTEGVGVPSLLVQLNTPLPPASGGGGNEGWQVSVCDVQPGPS